MDSDTIASVIFLHQQLWSLQLDEDRRDAWAQELKRIRLGKDAALAEYRRFCDRRAGTDRIPRLADVVSYLRKQQDAPSKGWRPTHLRCAYCGDTGYYTIVMPSSQQGGLYAPADFNPPAVWSETRVYGNAVPCFCTKGQKLEAKEPMPEPYRALRERIRQWHDESALGPTLTNFYYLQACHAAFTGSPEPESIPF